MYLSLTARYLCTLFLRCTPQRLHLNLLVPEGDDEVCHGHDLRVLLVRLGLLAVERVYLGLVQDRRHYKVLEHLPPWPNARGKKTEMRLHVAPPPAPRLAETPPLCRAVLNKQQHARTQTAKINRHAPIAHLVERARRHTQK